MPRPLRRGGGGVLRGWVVSMVSRIAVARWCGVALSLGLGCCAVFLEPISYGEGEGNGGTGASPAHGTGGATTSKELAAGGSTGGGGPTTIGSVNDGGADAPASLCDLPSSYYVMCDATGVQLNDSTRMHAWQGALDANRPPDVTEVYAIVYDVTQPSMITSGDHCSIVQTHTVDSYDACTTTFGTSGECLAPCTIDLSLLTGEKFTARYPALGRYSFRLMPRANGVVSVSIVPSLE